MSNASRGKRSTTGGGGPIVINMLSIISHVPLNSLTITIASHSIRSAVPLRIAGHCGLTVLYDSAASTSSTYSFASSKLLVGLSPAYILATVPVYDPTELSRAHRVATVQRSLRRLNHVHCHDPIQT